MKEKFQASHCYLKVDWTDSNAKDNNNTTLENTTTELLPGNHPVNPPASIIDTPTVATAKQVMITVCMQLRIQDEAKHHGLVQTQSKTRKQNLDESSHICYIY